MYPSFPHERQPLEPAALPPMPPAQRAPVFDPNTVVYPGGSTPEIALSPPPESGSELSAASVDATPPPSAETSVPDTIAENELATKGIAAATLSGPPRDASVQVEGSAENPMHIGNPAALARLEAAMSSKKEPPKPRDAAWWHAAEDVKNLAKAERADLRAGKVYWPAFDSGIQTGRAYGSPSPRAAFEYTFASVVPEGLTMQQDLEAVIADVDEPQKKVAELGGTGSRLTQELPVDGGVGVVLVDSRAALPDGQQIIAADEAQNHVVIEGDILREATRDKLHETLGGVKPAAIIIRMLGGKDILPDDVVGISHQADVCYGLLPDQGVLYCEIPRACEPYMKLWHEIASQHPGLQITYDFEGPKDGSSAFSPHLVMRLRKLPDAPEHLPVIPPRQFVTEYNKIIKAPKTFSSW